MDVIQMHHNFFPSLPTVQKFEWARWITEPKMTILDLPVKFFQASKEHYEGGLRKINYFQKKLGTCFDLVIMIMQAGDNVFIEFQVNYLNTHIEHFKPGAKLKEMIDKGIKILIL